MATPNTQSILETIISPRIVGNSTDGYAVKTDIVNIDNLQVVTINGSTPGSGSGGSGAVDTNGTFNPTNPSNAKLDLNGHSLTDSYNNTNGSVGPIGTSVKLETHLYLNNNNITGVGTINGFVPGASGWVGTATTNLNLNGHDLTDSTRDIKLGKALDLNGNNLTDSTRDIKLGKALDLNTNDIKGVKDITFTGQINGNSYPPPSGWVGTATTNLNMSTYSITGSNSVVNIGHTGTVDLNINSGVLKVGNNQVVGPRQPGWNITNADSAPTFFDGTTTDPATISSVLAKLIKSLTTHGLFGGPVLENLTITNNLNGRWDVSWTNDITNPVIHDLLIKNDEDTITLSFDIDGASITSNGFTLIFSNTLPGSGGTASITFGVSGDEGDYVGSSSFIYGLPSITNLSVGDFEGTKFLQWTQEYTYATPTFTFYDGNDTSINQNFITLGGFCKADWFAIENYDIPAKVAITNYDSSITIGTYKVAATLAGLTTARVPFTAPVQVAFTNDHSPNISSTDYFSFAVAWQDIATFSVSYEVYFDGNITQDFDEGEPSNDQSTYNPEGPGNIYNRSIPITIKPIPTDAGSYSYTVKVYLVGYGSSNTTNFTTNSLTYTINEG